LAAVRANVPVKFMAPDGGTVAVQANAPVNL